MRWTREGFSCDEKFVGANREEIIDERANSKKLFEHFSYSCFALEI